MTASLRAKPLRRKNCSKKFPISTPCLRPSAVAACSAEPASAYEAFARTFEASAANPLAPTTPTALSQPERSNPSNPATPSPTACALPSLRAHLQFRSEEHTSELQSPYE